MWSNFAWFWLALSCGLITIGTINVTYTNCWFNLWSLRIKGTFTSTYNMFNTIEKHLIVHTLHSVTLQFIEWLYSDLCRLLRKILTVTKRVAIWWKSVSVIQPYGYLVTLVLQFSVSCLLQCTVCVAVLGCFLVLTKCVVSWTKTALDCKNRGTAKQSRYKLHGKIKDWFQVAA